jgi:hypothetical protein
LSSSIETSAETAALIAWLNKQRIHCIDILDGLNDDVLATATLPSGWSALGMVQHLAFDIERFWFGAVVLGDEAVINGLAGFSAWSVVPETTGTTLFRQYREEIARSNRVLSEIDLDAAPKWWPDFFGDWRLSTNREVVLHVLTEISGHAGHLDAWRELTDGRLWFVLD